MATYEGRTVRPATKLAAFAAAIAIVFAGALAVGAAAPPVGMTERAPGTDTMVTDRSMEAGDAMGTSGRVSTVASTFGITEVDDR